MIKLFRMTVFALLFLLTLFAMIPGYAATPITEIQSLLEKPEVICGRFNQTKYLVNIKKPLTSNGRFCVVANRGVLWQTLKPFPNTLRLTRDAIVQTQDGQIAMQLNANQEPVVKMINSVLFSLLAGDLTELQKLFDMDGSLKNNYWKIDLQARASALAKAIGRISLEGGKYVKKVTMNEANGDHTIIIFSAVKSGQNAITSEERALLGHQS